MYSNINVSEGKKNSAQDIVLQAGSDDCLQGCYHVFQRTNIRPFKNHTIYFRVTALSFTTTPLTIQVRAFTPNYIVSSWTVQDIGFVSSTGYQAVSFGGDTPNLTGQVFNDVSIVFHCPSGTTATFEKVVLLSQ